MDAVNEVVSHRYFQPHVTPVQVSNRVTDPWLVAVGVYWAGEDHPVVAADHG